MHEDTDDVRESNVDDSDSPWPLSDFNKVTKAIFDHFRNYLICASIFIAGREANISYDVEPLDKFIIAIAFILTALNAFSVLFVIWGMFAYVTGEVLKGDLDKRIKNRVSSNAPIAALFVSGLYLAVVGAIINFTVSIRF